MCAEAGRGHGSHRRGDEEEQRADLYLPRRSAGVRSASPAGLELDRELARTSESGPDGALETNPHSNRHARSRNPFRIAQGADLPEGLWPGVGRGPATLADVP